MVVSCSMNADEMLRARSDGFYRICVKGCERRLQALYTRAF